MPYDAEIRATLEGQTNLLGEIVTCSEAPVNYSESRVGSGNVDWYRKALLRQKQACESDIADQDTPPGERRFANQALMKIQELLEAAEQYEWKQQAQAVADQRRRERNE